MKEILDQINTLDQAAKCKDKVFRETVLLYIEEVSDTYIKNKIYSFHRNIRNDKFFRNAVRQFVERLVKGQ